MIFSLALFFSSLLKLLTANPDFHVKDSFTLVNRLNELETNSDSDLKLFISLDVVAVYEHS